MITHVSKHYRTQALHVVQNYDIFTVHLYARTVTWAFLRHLYVCLCFVPGFIINNIYTIDIPFRKFLEEIIIMMTYDYGMNNMKRKPATILALHNIDQHGGY